MAGTKMLLAVICSMFPFLQLAVAQFGPTCQSLDNVASSAQSMTCTRNARCDTVNCTITQVPYDGTPLTVTVLPCRGPPALHVVVKDKESGAVILNKVLNHTETGISISSGVTLDLTLNQLNHSIGFAVTVNVFFPITLLPYSVIVLDLDSCVSPEKTTGTPTPTTMMVTETPMPTTVESLMPTEDVSSNKKTTGTPTPTTMMVTETPMPTTAESPLPTEDVSSNKSTCDVLAELAKSPSAFKCVADSKEPCDHVNCSAALIGSKFNAEFVLLPCHVPYAVQITMSHDGKVVVNKTVDHSQEIDIPELFNMKLNITLNQYPDAIELKIDAILGVIGTNPKVIAPLTVIPMDKSGCDKKVESGPNSNTAVPGATVALLNLLLLLCLSIAII